jgi:hypothetical protein
MAAPVLQRMPDASPRPAAAVSRSPARAPRSSASVVEVPPRPPMHVAAEPQRVTISSAGAPAATQAAPPVAAPAAPQPGASVALAAPPASTPVEARPEPTREAVLAAYRRAMAAQAAAAPAPSPALPPAPATTVSVLARSAARPAPAPAPAITPFGISTLARVQVDDPAGEPDTTDDAPAAEPPDLEALADYVLERLRHELRDGRERLGYLLDDTR